MASDRGGSLSDRVYRLRYLSDATIGLDAAAAGY